MSITSGFPISKTFLLRISSVSGRHLQKNHHSNRLKSVSTPKDNGDTRSSSSKDKELMRQTTDNNYESKKDEKFPTQLWLDIRGLSISPTEAIRDLSVILNNSEDGDENNCSPVAKVLISKEEAKKFSNYIHCDNGLNDEKSPEILVVDTASPTMVLGHSLHSSSKHNGNDEVEKCGILISLRDKTSCDPVAVIEALTKFEWIVIDATEIKQEMEKQEAVGNLLGFIAAVGVNPIPIVIDWDLVVPQNQLDENYASASSSSTGGIAICCQTKGDLVNAQNCIHLLNVGRFIDTSEGGILLLSSSDKEVDDENMPSKNIPQSQSAVVIPFDLMMWKAALSIFDFH